MSSYLIKHGDSYAFVIDKAILELLKIDPTEPVEWSTDGRSLIITPVSSDDEARFQRAMEDCHKRYGRMLKRLAE